MSIISYIKSLVRNIGKEDIFEDIRITRKEISDNLIPLMQDANKYFRGKTLKASQVNYLNKVFMEATGGKAKYKNMFDYLNDKLPKMLANLEILSDELDKNLETQVVTKTVTYRKAILLKALDLMSFDSAFTFKMLKFVYYFEDKEMGGESEYDDLIMPKPLVDSILKNAFVYAKSIKALSVSSDEFLTKIKELKDIPLDEESVSIIKAKQDKDTLEIETLDPVGFEGNPIFHYRLMVAEWQANRYKLNKETKQYLELKLMDMKLKGKDSNDASLQRQIEYTSKRINKLEYSMAKAEKSVGGLD